MKALKIFRSALLLLIIAMLCVSCAPVSDNIHTVEYQVVQNGKIEGLTVQSVKNGQDTKEVTAIPNAGFTFDGWSDGVTEATRSETNVTEDIFVYPIFKAIPYTITYKGMCGTEELYSYVFENTNGTNTDFNAEAILPGYKFMKWSDDNKSATRTDGFGKDGMTLIAYYREAPFKVPKISIKTEHGAPITSKEVYLKCTVDVDSFNSEYNFKGITAQIRGRGNYTWDGCPKKSYRLRFDEKRSVLGSDNEDRNWVLLSNGWDNSCARNYIAHELAERFKTIGFASMHEFVELEVNGEYRGLYLICDLIQTGKGRLDLNEDLSNHNDLSFLIKRDTYAEKEGQIVDVEYFTLENDYDHCFEIHFPDPDAPDYKADVYVPYIKNYLYDAMEAIRSGDWELIQQYIDVENFAEAYIIHECILNLDVGWNSFYMYKNKGGRLCLGPMWDFDLSAGNYDAISNGDGAQDYYPAYDVDQYETLWGLKQNPWLRRMARVPEYVELLQKKLDELDSTLKEVYKLTDPNNSQGIYQKNKSAMDKNMETWGVFGVGSAHIKSLKTMEGQHQYLYEWLMGRLKVVRVFYGMSEEKGA